MWSRKVLALSLFGALLLGAGSAFCCPESMQCPTVSSHDEPGHQPGHQPENEPDSEPVGGAMASAACAMGDSGRAALASHEDPTPRCPLLGALSAPWAHSRVSISESSHPRTLLGAGPAGPGGIVLHGALAAPLRWNQRGTTIFREDSPRLYTLHSALLI